MARITFKRHIATSERDGMMSSEQAGKLGGIGVMYHMDRAPTVTDDETNGYKVKDGWYDSNGKDFYRCSDATADNADWQLSTLTAEEAEAIAQGEVITHNAETEVHGAGTGDRIALSSEVKERIAKSQGSVTWVDCEGTDVERGAALSEAIDNVSDGDTLLILAGLNYDLTADKIFGGDNVNPNLITIGDGLTAKLTGKSVILDTAGMTHGIDWTTSINDAGFKNGSMPVVNGGPDNYPTKAGVISYCKSGDYDVHDMELVDFNYELYHCVFGAEFCDDATIKGDIYDSEIGTTTWDRSIESKVYRTEFTGDTAAELIGRLGNNGVLINCIDSTGHLIPVPVHDLGTVDGDVAVDGRIARLQTLTVGASGVTDIDPTGLDEVDGLSILVDNLGGYSIDLPLTTAPGGVIRWNELPTDAGVFWLMLTDAGGYWHVTISETGAVD